MKTSPHSLPVNIGIVGATGMVGQKILEILVERKFSVGTLRLFASARSAGKSLTWNGRSYVIEDSSKADFSSLDYVFLSAGGDTTKTQVSRELCPKVVADGAIAIDNSSAWRSDPDVPLVVSEVNPEALRNIPKGIVANPNCTTMIGMVALKPLHNLATLRSINVASYQSVSGQGQSGIDELVEQTKTMLKDPSSIVDGAIRDTDLPKPKVFPALAGFNAAPHAGSFQGRDTTEELKFVNESRKILGLSNLSVSATCVRVGVLNAHSLKISVGFERPITPEQAEKVLADSPGVELVQIPQPVLAAGRDEVLVGRIRPDVTQENGLELFLSGDNLRKGAALNAVQIAELLLARR